MSHAERHKSNKQLSDAIKKFAKTPMLDPQEDSGLLQTYQRIVADMVQYPNADRLRMGDYAKKYPASLKDFIENKYMDQEGVCVENEHEMLRKKEEALQALEIFENTRKIFVQAADNKLLPRDNQKEQLKNLRVLPEALAKLIEMSGYMETDARATRWHITSDGRDAFDESPFSADLPGEEETKLNDAARRLKRRELRANGISEKPKLQRDGSSTIEMDDILEGYNPAGDYGAALDLQSMEVNRCRAEQFFLQNFKRAFECIVMPVLGEERASNSSARDIFG